MKSHNHGFWKIGIMFILLAAIAIAVVMFLWNQLMPVLFDLPVISYWQAAGLLILSKILLSPFGKKPAHSPGRRPWTGRMKDQWDCMSPEEKEHFRKNWGWKSHRDTVENQSTSEKE